jgi:hypothetical protein
VFTSREPALPRPPETPLCGLDAGSFDPGSFDPGTLDIVRGADWDVGGDFARTARTTTSRAAIAATTSCAANASTTFRAADAATAATMVNLSARPYRTVNADGFSGQES